MGRLKAVTDGARELPSGQLAGRGEESFEFRLNLASAIWYLALQLLPSCSFVPFVVDRIDYG